MVFKGRGFTFGGQKSVSGFSAAACKIQGSKCYIESLPFHAVNDKIRLLQILISSYTRHSQPVNFLNFEVEHRVHPLHCCKYILHVHISWLKSVTTPDHSNKLGAHHNSWQHWGGSYWVMKKLVHIISLQMDRNSIRPYLAAPATHGAMLTVVQALMPHAE